MKASVFVIIFGVVWVSGLLISAPAVLADTAISTSFILIDSFSFGQTGSSTSSSFSQPSQGGSASAQGGSSTSFKSSAPLTPQLITRTSRGSQTSSRQNESITQPVTPSPSPTPDVQKPAAPTEPKKIETLPKDVSAPSSATDAPSSGAGTTQPSVGTGTQSVLERTIETITKPIKQLFGGSRSSEQRLSPEPTPEPQQLAQVGGSAGSVVPNPIVKQEGEQIREQEILQPVEVEQSTDQQAAVQSAPGQSRIQNIRKALLNSQQKIVRVVHSAGQAVVDATQAVESRVIGFWQRVKLWFRWTVNKTTSSFETMEAWAKTSWRPGLAIASVRENMIDDIVAINQVLPVPEIRTEQEQIAGQEPQEEWDAFEDRAVETFDQLRWSAEDAVLYSSFWPRRSGIPHAAGLDQNPSKQK